MKRQKFAQQGLGAILTVLLAAGCGAPPAPSTPTPILPTAVPTPAPPLVTEIPLITTPAIPTATTPQPQVPAPLGIQDMRLLTTPGGVLVFLNDLSAVGKLQVELYATSGEKMVLLSTSRYPVEEFPANVSPRWQISPNGAMIADFTDDESGLIKVSDLNSPASAAQLTAYRIPETTAGPTAGIIEAISWSPDSTRLLVTTRCNIFVLSLVTGEFTLIDSGCPPIVPIYTGPLDAAWSPDGTRIAYDILDQTKLPDFVEQLKGERPSILVIAGADGKAHVLVDGNGASPVWSPDGQRILYTGGYRQSGEDVYIGEKLYGIQNDGSNRVEIHSLTGTGLNPPFYTELGWSSDSARIFSNMDGKLVGMQPDGTLLTTLSEKAVKSYYLPSVDRILWLEEFAGVFASDLEGNSKNLLSATASYPHNWENVAWCGEWITVENDHLEWVISHLDGSLQVKLPGPPAPPGLIWKRKPVFSSDCSEIAFFNYATWGYAVSDPGGTNARPLTPPIPEGLSIIGWVPGQP